MKQRYRKKISSRKSFDKLRCWRRSYVKMQESDEEHIRQELLKPHTGAQHIFCEVFFPVVTVGPD